MELKPEEITKIIRSQIKNYENKIEVSETGVVILVGDGIAKASGLEKCMAGELVEFPDGSYGMAQNLEEDTVSIVILGSDQGIKEGDTVKRTGRVVSVPRGREAHRARCQRPRRTHRRQGQHRGGGLPRHRNARPRYH